MPTTVRQSGKRAKKPDQQEVALPPDEAPREQPESPSSAAAREEVLHRHTAGIIQRGYRGPGLKPFAKVRLGRCRPEPVEQPTSPPETKKTKARAFLGLLSVSHCAALLGDPLLSMLARRASCWP